MDTSILDFSPVAILWFTSGAIPADCIVVSLAAEPFRFTYKLCPQGLVGFEPTTVHAAAQICFVLWSGVNLLFQSREFISVNLRFCTCLTSHVKHRLLPLSKKTLLYDPRIFEKRHKKQSLSFSSQMSQDKSTWNKPSAKTNKFLCK